MIEAIKEEMNESFKEIQENITKQIKELKKIVQDLKTEIEAIKKQTEGIMKMENIEKRTGTPDASIIKRKQEMEERISGIENTIEKNKLMSKKILNLKVCDTKNSRNLEYYEKTKHNNNRN